MLNLKLRSLRVYLATCVRERGRSKPFLLNTDLGTRDLGKVKIETRKAVELRKKWTLSLIKWHVKPRTRNLRGRVKCKTRNLALGSRGEMLLEVRKHGRRSEMLNSEPRNLERKSEQRRHHFSC